MGWLVFLTAIVLLPAALFYLQKKAKAKTGQADKGRGTATMAQAEAGQTKSAAPQFRILVVDDDAAISRTLVTKLKLAGFSAQSSGSGEDALNILLHEKFDAIISDLNMPEMSGLELLAAVRHRIPHTAFLMAMGESDVAVGVTAMTQGAADFILKPFQMETVKVSLRRALEMKRREAELGRYGQHLESMAERRTKELMAALGRIESTYDETLEALHASLNLRGHDTAGHSQRVALYSVGVANRLNFSPTQLKQLERGAYLHDIGKIGIPDSILLKPGKLTPEETAVMQTHVRIGYEFTSRLAFLSSAALIIRSHHESYDGTGYPQGLKGSEIPVGARIVAVANAFDNMVSDLPYRRGRSTEEAVAELRRCSGTQFDPDIVEAFVRSLEISGESTLKSPYRNTP